MRLLCYLALTLLCALWLSWSEAAITCSDTQRPWPVTKPTSCCNKCPPGTHLDGRRDSCNPTCIKCEDKMYLQTYNMALTCDNCENCRRTNMEYLSPCNATHNAVCKCKAGFECKTKPCVQCLPIPATTTTVTTTTTTTTTTPATSKSTVITLVTSSSTRSLQRDAFWYPIIIALLSVGIFIIALIFVIRNKAPLLRYISSVKYGYPRPKPHTAVPLCCMDEEISKPVQEAGCDCILKTDPELFETAQIQV